MNEPQITWRGFLVIFAIAAVIGTLGFIDNKNRELIKAQQEIAKCRS
ncbi:hypothetical protein SAMN05216420_101353 [Nitrosospira sp. Nl5]|nr:hypothetical protein [Nitrosospira sp. Nl5]SCX92613.1 hypothetical protein SAMN05216420_101353 [Nitrosospira sp. Nl5]